LVIPLNILIFACRSLSAPVRRTIPATQPTALSPVNSPILTRTYASTIFEKGLRGIPPGPLLRLFNQSLYEGQLAGYLRYLDEAKTKPHSEKLALSDLCIGTTTGDRVVAGTIAACAFGCAAFLMTQLVFALPQASRADWDIHIVMMYLILGIVFGLFVILGCVCLMVVFERR
jgi:hypothetical protein